ncbi:MAG TPA: hypothetical protein DCR24_12755 [Bacillus bacterium]|nr:hypothetical protein [Bacillus sp. (in: firmicutes)]
MPSSPYIETPPLIWQTYLFLDVFKHSKKGNMIKYHTIRQAFLKRVNRGHVRLRTIPLAGRGDYLHPLAEYVFLLVKVSFLERLNSATVKQIGEMNIPATIEAQIESEAQFLRKYENKMEESFFK